MHTFVAAFADELVKVGAARVLASTLTPQSSNVRGFSYDPASQTLTVTYKSGGTYRYSGVPASVERALKRNKSVGKTIHRLVKAPGYQYEKIGSPTLPNSGALNIKEIFKAMLASPGLQRIHGHMRPMNKLAATKKRLRILAHEAAEMALGRAMKKREREKQEKFATSNMNKQAAELAPAIAEYFSKSIRWMNKLAGVAKKQITFGGLKLKIEYEPGDIRTGRSKDGKTWERKMHAYYGYIPGTKGKAADGDAIDIYLSPEPVETAPVYEIRQEKKEGGYDESKFMLGWETADRARAAYLQHMPKWAFGSIKQVADSVQDFAESLKMEKAANDMPWRKPGAKPPPPPKPDSGPPLSLKTRITAVRTQHALGHKPLPMNLAAPSTASSQPQLKPAQPKQPTTTSSLPFGKQSSPLMLGFADELAKVAGQSGALRRAFRRAFLGDMDGWRRVFSTKEITKDLLRKLGPALALGGVGGFALGRMSKEAGPRTILRRLFHGKQTPIRLGFFERRRLAKAFGVRPRDVERILERRQQMRRLIRGGAMLGAAGVGGLVGHHIGDGDA